MNSDDFAGVLISAQAQALPEVLATSCMCGCRCSGILPSDVVCRVLWEKVWGSMGQGAVCECPFPAVMLGCSAHPSPAVRVTSPPVELLESHDASDFSHRHMTGSVPALPVCVALSVRWV